MNYTPPTTLGETTATSEFERQVQQVRPRFIDTYVLPGFLIWYAIRSKEMPKRARRILFISGVYAGYRSYDAYKQAFQRVVSKVGLPDLKTPGGQNVRSA